MALCARLVWPTPPVVLPGDVAALAIFGEHALCLAAPVSTEPAPLRSVPPADDRADHDHSICCLGHAATGFVVPPIAAVMRLTFTTTATLIATAAEFRPGELIGPARARGPPIPG